MVAFDLIVFANDWLPTNYISQCIWSGIIINANVLVFSEQSDCLSIFINVRALAKSLNVGLRLIVVKVM